MSSGTPHREHCAPAPAQEPSTGLLGAVALWSVVAALVIVFLFVPYSPPSDAGADDAKAFAEGAQAARDELLPRVAAAYAQGQRDALAAARCEARK